LINSKSESSNELRASLRHALIIVIGFTFLHTLFFAPVLFSHRLLAPGDGIIYFLPNFASARVLWDPSIWGGFPAVGDPQLMLWYPPALLFSIFGTAGYQPFVLAAFVLASSFTYGYVLTIARSRTAAAISGCVYGLSGFLVVHLGHAALIHTAAWLPLIVWSLAMLQRARISRAWLIIAVLSVTCAALAGHPQIFVYTMMLAGAFVLVNGSRSAIGRWRYYGLCALVCALGVGIAAVQLWPTADLTNQSWRAALDFTEFNAYALPFRQAAAFLFPFLYGGAPTTLYGTPYFGAWPSSADGWGAGELSGYVGLLPLMLAFIGFVAHRRCRTAQFWLGVCIVAFILSLGSGTPLAHVTYLLPIINKFRAPARHFLELTFAISILSGLGIQAIQQQASKIRVPRIVIGAAVVLCAALISLILFRGKINELAIQRLGHTITLKPWSNAALAVPLLIFVGASVALVWWRSRPQSPARVVVLLLVLIADLASFGWFGEWHYRAPYKAYLRAPAAADNYRAELRRTGQRLLPVRGGTGRVSELPPNLSKLWDLESASGYGPFILTRVSRLLTMPPHGSVDESWREPANQDLDLMAVRYLIVPPDQIEPSTKDDRGVSWAVSDFNVQLGGGCDPKNSNDFGINLPAPQRASQIGIVSALACSIPLADGQAFATVVLTDVDDRKIELQLGAGRDSSEWAFDCADVRPIMKQGRAPVFRSYPITRGEVKCEGHDYVALLRLSSLNAIKRIEFHSVASAGTFALKKITVLDDATRTSTPINPVAGSLEDATRWRRVGEINTTNAGYGPEVNPQDVGAAVVFENLRARPRVWLTPEVVTVSEEQALTAVRSSRLPDGRQFDPARVALVEEPLSFKSGEVDQTATAQVTRLSEREMEVRVTTQAPAFLVTSDVYYPGWRVSIDGAPAHLYQTDYALRGVGVPTGTHLVRFEFRPVSFYRGAVVTALSLVLLAGCAWRFRIILPRLNQASHP
jgi:hypothetical protein